MEKDFPLARSRAYRNLSHSPYYHGLLADSPIYDSKYAKKTYPLQLDPEEYLVGVYENKWGEKKYDLPPETKVWDTIVISSQALYLGVKEKFEKKIYFKDIQEIDGSENTRDDLVVHIIMKDTSVIDLAILRTNEPKNNVKDVFSWWNFLRSFPRTSFGSKEINPS